MANKQNVTLEDVLAIVDKVAGRNTQTQTAVPTVQVQRPDSFEILTGGILRGWPLITGILALAAFLFNMNSAIQAHEANITANTHAIQQIETKLDSQATVNNTNNNEVVRRLDNLQKDVDILKTK